MAWQCRRSLSPRRHVNKARGILSPSLRLPPSLRPASPPPSLLLLLLLPAQQQQQPTRFVSATLEIRSRWKLEGKCLKSESPILRPAHIKSEVLVNRYPHGIDGSHCSNALLQFGDESSKGSESSSDHGAEPDFACLRFLNTTAMDDRFTFTTVSCCKAVPPPNGVCACNLRLK